MKKHNRFDRSGCFTCGICKRQTRNTGDNGGCDLCPECYEVAGIENQIADKSFYEGQTQKSLEAEILALNTRCVSKGGVIPGFTPVVKKLVVAVKKDGTVAKTKKLIVAVKKPAAPKKNAEWFDAGNTVRYHDKGWQHGVVVAVDGDRIRVAELGTHAVRTLAIADTKPGMWQVAAEKASQIVSQATTKKESTMKNEKTHRSASKSTVTNNQKITLLAKSNPKKKGSACYKRFALYRNGMLVATFLEKGGTTGDLRYDVAKKFIKVN